MTGGQVAACDYAPAGWPAGTYTLIRRVKIPVEQLSTDPRSRRRRTVAKDQLALALGGAADHVWAVSFIVTNIPANHGDYVGLEAWFRNRTSIEERFREGKHGGGLNHLPSADVGVNSVWMWAGLLAGATSVMLQTLTGLDRQAHAPGRMQIATLRHRLLAVPGRLISHARNLDPATTTRPADCAGRPEPVTGTSRTDLNDTFQPYHQGPRRHRPARRPTRLPTPSRKIHRPPSHHQEQDHNANGGSRSDERGTLA